MKIGILSDIHANSAALDAVFDSPRLADVDALLVAGDFVGYYFDPKYVIDKIRAFKKPIYCVRGNHEEMLIRAMHDPKQLQDINFRYGPGISIALEQLVGADLKWISSLPHPLFIKDLPCSFLLCHGSPLSIDEYTYPDSPLDTCLSTLRVKPDVVVMGHTHYPFVRLMNDCLIINPGSVGQPRNKKPGAHWALLDTHTMNVTLCVESYDSTDLQKKCLDMAPHNSYLYEVLTRS